MNATGHSCKVGDRQSTYLIDKIELESQGAMKNEFSCSKMDPTMKIDPSPPRIMFSMVTTAVDLSSSSSWTLLFGGRIVILHLL